MDRFEPTWNAALKRHDIPYFHMSEIPNPKSHMHKFCGRDGADKLKALLADLVSALATSSVLGQFTGIGGVVPLEPLSRFNTERRRNIEPVPLALFTCLALMKSAFPDQTIETVLDNLTKATRKIEIAKKYLATSPKLSGNDLVSVRPAERGFDAIPICPLQAADFAAYEVWRKYERLEPFFEVIDLKDITAMEYWYEYENWCEANRRPSPDERRSLTALADASKFTCPIWTYELLCAEDDARGGRWTR